MDDPVLEHVPGRVRGLPRRSEKVRVVPIGEHRPGALHHLVEGARHPDLEPLHRAAQRFRVGRLHDAVDVVPLHREVHQAEAESLAPASEGQAQRAEAAVRAKVPHFPAHAERDVQRSFSKGLSRTMRNVRPRGLAFAPGALSRTAPPTERQFLLIYFHARDRREGV